MDNATYYAHTRGTTTQKPKKCAIIQKDGGYNKVVLPDSGRVWRCINRDMIFNEQNRHDTFLIKRTNYNYFTRYDETDRLNCIDEPYVYSDAEIKLLFAIDPYGVAAYVERYADYQGGLKETLDYKDRIFKLLFNREPSYFARMADGKTWYKTTDKSHLTAVQSESECVFGMHAIWDWYTQKELIEAIGTMIQIVLNVIYAAPSVATYLTNHLTANKIAKVFSFTASFIGSGFISALGDSFVDDMLDMDSFNETAFENTSLNWAYQMVSLYSSIMELAHDFDMGANYYKQIFNYCVHTLDYDIYVELKDGCQYHLSDISELLTGN